MRPEPEIIYEMPMPLWLRARKAFREFREGIAFVIQVFRRKPSPARMAELSAFERMVAMNINSASVTRTLSGGL